MLHLLELNQHAPNKLEEVEAFVKGMAVGTRVAADLQKEVMVVGFHLLWLWRYSLYDIEERTPSFLFHFNTYNVQLLNMSFCIYIYGSTEG
jgi:hypothetical protein